MGERSGADRRLFGRRGLLLGGIGAAVAGALGRAHRAEAQATGPALILGAYNVTPGPETALEGDLFVGTAWAGGSLMRFSDADSDGGTYESTCRFWDICDPSFDPAGVRLDRATLQLLTDMPGRIPLVTRHTQPGEKAAVVDGDCDIVGDCHVGGSCAVDDACTIVKECDVGGDFRCGGNFSSSTVGQVLCAADSETCQIVSSACTPDSLVCVTPASSPGPRRFIEFVQPGLGVALVKFNRAPTLDVLLNWMVANPLVPRP